MAELARHFIIIFNVVLELETKSDDVESSLDHVREHGVMVVKILLFEQRNDKTVFKCLLQ